MINPLSLSEAANTFVISGLGGALLLGQEKAYETCLAFLRFIGKSKNQNRRHSSYRLKHIVELPSRLEGPMSGAERYHGYIYEGTFILAALASGFTMEQKGKHLGVTFNICERTLRRRVEASRGCSPFRRQPRSESS
jgi:hypothetical protein